MQAVARDRCPRSDTRKRPIRPVSGVRHPTCVRGGDNRPKDQSSYPIARAKANCLGSANPTSTNQRQVARQHGIDVEGATK